MTAAIVFVNDKANTRVARIRLDVMKCDKIIEIPNAHSIHGLRLQRYPRTGYVFCNGENRVPIPNIGKLLDESKKWRSIFTAVDGDTMTVAWQVIVSGNLDNNDADYKGKYVASTCYNSEEGTTVAEMMSSDKDHVVVFNIAAIEQAIKDNKYDEINGIKVLDGTKTSQAQSDTRYIPVANSPHGCNAAPDGKHLVVAGKLSPTVTIIEWDKLDDLFAGKIKENDAIVGNLEVGLGPLHTAFDGKGNCYTSLFLDSQVVKWNLDEALAGLSGRKGEPDQAEDRRPLPDRPHQRDAERDQGGRRQVGGGALQVLEGSLPQRRSVEAGERAADRYLRRQDGARARQLQLRRAARRHDDACLEAQPDRDLEARRPDVRRRAGVGEEGRRQARAGQQGHARRRQGPRLHDVVGSGVRLVAVQGATRATRSPCSSPTSTTSSISRTASPS